MREQYGQRHTDRYGYRREDAQRYLKARRRQRALTSYGLPLAALAVGIVLWLLALQIPSGSRAERLAANLGIQDAHVTSRSPAFGAFSGCKQDDLVKFTVEGHDAFGHVRVVEVCAPVIGGYTVRG